MKNCSSFTVHLNDVGKKSTVQDRLWIWTLQRLPFSLCFGCYKSLSSRGGNRETTKILVDLHITKKYSFSDKFEEMR